MHFEPHDFYHVYNNGNNNQPIFFNRNNYLYFLKRVRAEWMPFCDMLAYCLLPNKFDFLLTPNNGACENIILKGKEMHMQQLSKTIGKTLSSYTQTINGEKNRTGNLFQKKTKAKNLNAEFDPSGLPKSDLLLNYLDYIHYLPVETGFCKSPVEWEMSSARDYAGLRKGTFCNKELLTELTRNKDFGSENPVFSRELIKRIY
jgi:hypothetical protein